ncbi:MAG: FkbM family methyltransferase [Synergistaceae bacterium]|nr:FkbM family methyltransferase [Synergistaceae bacterium]
MSVSWRVNRARYGLDTWGEFFLRCVDSLTSKIFAERTHFYESVRAKRLLKSDGLAYHIKDIKLPVLTRHEEDRFIFTNFDDTFIAYSLFDDKYDEKTFDLTDALIPEGLYGLVNDKVNVTVEPDDIVIDAGSWIGDFAAYASVMGATTYAFEPVDNTFAILEKTAELNGRIIPVKKGLSNENVSRKIFVNDAMSSGNSFIANADHADESLTVETTTIDDFVRENHLPRVDFIKADIEGFERHMLAGAQDTLARFAPKLALCTYHLPDDPQVMADLILKANPKYNIVQKRKKLFASVPE